MFVGAAAVAAEAESKKEQLALQAEQAIEDRHERENKMSLQVTLHIFLNNDNAIRALFCHTC